jgi:predicted transposase/invertase (TIGR01784 family)
MDYDSGLGDARREGLQEGRQEGRQEEKLGITRNLLREKTPVEVISRVTGLPLEEVKRLAAEIGQ